jgi:hypothetical protein
MKKLFSIAGSVAFPALLLAAGSAVPVASGQPAKEDWAKTFAVDKKDFVSSGSSRYFRLEPGYELKLEGREGLSKVILIVTVLGETRVVDGVETRVVEERESKGGTLVEVSRNYFALNTADKGIYYFGEAVDIYENGKVTSHEGAWESGRDGARFGLLVPGAPRPGMRFYQEVAPGVAMDRAEVVSITESIRSPAGEFRGCLKTEETTPLEPGAKEYKVYAPGIGLVGDASLVLVSCGFAKKQPGRRMGGYLATSMSSSS